MDPVCPAKRRHGRGQNVPSRLRCAPMSGITLVTGSTGHLGEALVRTLRAAGRPVRGVDLAPSPWTDVVGSITDPALVERCMDGVGDVVHAATLHKPHVGSHSRQQFVDTNITGTLNL